MRNVSLQRSQPTPKKAVAKVARSGVVSFSKVLGFVRSAKRKGQTIVTTNGCFDILHVGHIRYLEAARKKGDILVVGINSDASVRAIKGKLRPIVSERERAEIVGALHAVDAAFTFNEEAPDRWLAKVRPDVHVKGADWKGRKMPEREIVEKCGGRIVLVPLTKNKSTSALIRRVIRLQ